jgi:NAD(P) transhydrogenase
MVMDAFDLIVIGTGPAGEKAAVKAAYFGHKVAIIEKEKTYGGAEVTTGTLPSKTLKETALFLSGKFEKGVYGVERGLEHAASIEDFMYRKTLVCSGAHAAIKDNLGCHKVAVFHATASFVDPHTLELTSKEGKKERISGRYIIIATGSYPYHPQNIAFDKKRIHDSDSILELTRFPSSLCIVGAGVIGCEYATIFATMGTKVFLVNDKERILPFVDHEVSTDLVKQMQDASMQILFNDSVESITPPATEKEPVRIRLKSGKTLETDMFLFAAGRNGNIKELNATSIGLQIGRREQIFVNERYQTNIPHIYAVGDVIGFPALASTSMDQGRVAVAHIFQTQDLEHLPSHFPYGIYTIPEVSMVGLTEEEARKREIPVCVGRAQYKEMPRGIILGTKAGFLKLVFSRDELRILGVHIIGHLATELIHYGVMLVEEKKTLFDVIGQVFNFPTLHELYKYASYDGLGNRKGHNVKA